MGSHEVSERSRRLLATLVRDYIETGEPVSSQLLARQSGLGLSSATVRNILAQLEDGGYVHQPHTSSGRVPTDRGYRVFVDLLLESRKRVRPPTVVEHHLREQAERSPLLDDVLASVSHFVSRAAKHVGFALAGNPARQCCSVSSSCRSAARASLSSSSRAAARSRRRWSMPART